MTHGCDVAAGTPLAILNGDALGRAVPSDPYIRRPGEAARAGLAHTRVVIPGGVHHGDAVVAETVSLVQQKPLGGKGEELSVEEVPGHKEGLDVLSDGQVHGSTEGLSGSFAESPSNGLGAARKSCIQVDIGQMDEAHMRR
jgi:hypothetical protein